MVRVAEGKITVNVRRKFRGNRLWFKLARLLFLSQPLFGKRVRARRGGNRANVFGLKSIAPWCVPHQLQIALKN